jgi:hypothetical protein
MPLRQSPRQVLLRPRRHQLQSASRYRSAELVAHRARASGGKSPLSARYGQNNPAIAIGKKNSLFCGNEGGGATWAILASLLNTCKLHGVDPETYLTDVLERMVSGATKNNRLHELLVWNWQAARETEKVAA